MTPNADIIIGPKKSPLNCHYEKLVLKVDVRIAVVSLAGGFGLVMTARNVFAGDVSRITTTVESMAQCVEC